MLFLRRLSGYTGNKMYCALDVARIDFSGEFRMETSQIVVPSLGGTSIFLNKFSETVAMLAYLSAFGKEDRPLKPNWLWGDTERTLDVAQLEFHLFSPKRRETSFSMKSLPRRRLPRLIYVNRR